MSVLVKFSHTLFSLVFSCLVMVAGSSAAFAQDTAGKDTAEKGAPHIGLESREVRSLGRGTPRAL